MIYGINKKRFINYLLVLGLLPSFFLYFSQKQKLSEVKRVEKAFTSLEKDLELLERKQAFNKRVQNYYRSSDRFYLNKRLEPLMLLEEEKQNLKAAIQKTGFANSKAAEKRFEYLQSSANQISFTEESLNEEGSLKESHENLSKAVEVNISDLKKILCLVEGVDIVPYKAPQDRPQLIIKALSLNRKKNGDKSESFLLKMSVIKREFL